ncbi:hypothetical protein D3C77_535380 [compost metagenome]
MFEYLCSFTQGGPVMDIAALSTGLSQANLKQNVSISLLKMVQDEASVQSEALAKMMQQSVLPHLGGNVDIKV